MPRADARIRPYNDGKTVESPNVYHSKTVAQTTHKAL